MLCKSCRHCADGMGGWRKCYYNNSTGITMSNIPKDIRNDCEHYMQSDIPSHMKYSIERCPECDNDMALVKMGDGVLRPECEYCGYVGNIRYRCS